MNTLQWWGYRHTNGGVQAKRFFDIRDIQDAHESPFVKEVVGPFECGGRDEALALVDKLTTK